MKNKDFWKTMIQLLISILTAALTAMGTTSCMGRGPFYEPANLAHIVAVAYMVNNEYRHDCANAFAPSGRNTHPLFTQGVALGYVLVAPSGRAPYNPTPYALRTVRTIPFVHQKEPSLLCTCGNRSGQGSLLCC